MCGVPRGRLCARPATITTEAAEAGGATSREVYVSGSGRPTIRYIDGRAAAGAGEAAAPAATAPAGGGLAVLYYLFLYCRAARAVDQSSSGRHQIQLTRQLASFHATAAATSSALGTGPGAALRAMRTEPP
eukprot:COSAG06_NODE_880_length_11804_cov_13.493721_3_plen_131_part_00